LAEPDTTDPTLTWANLPAVDVTSAGETVAFLVGALDTGSGIDRVHLYFDHDWEGQSGLECVVALTDSADSFSDGQSAAPVYFDPGTAAGTYSITTAIVCGAMTDWLGLANGGFQDNAANGYTNVPTSWHVAIGEQLF